MNDVLRPAIITLVLILILASTMGCLEDTIDDDNHRHMITINLSSPDIGYSEESDNTTFNVEVQVLKITPSEEQIRWDEVYFNISWRPDIKRIAHVPVEGQAPPDDKEFYVYYLEEGPTNGIIDTNDTIRFVGMDDGFVDSKWSMIMSGHAIGSMYIPTKHVRMSYSSTELRRENDVVWYLLHFQLDFVFSPGMTLEWEDCQVEKRQLMGEYEYISLESYPITFGSAIEAWYLNSDNVTATLNVGDTITITGLSIAYQDGSMRLSHKYETMGVVGFPDKFN